jgi:hypothetical protein
MLSSLLSILLGDETRHWPAPQARPLTMDVARQSLNGVKLGDPADRVREFGRPRDRRPITAGMFMYPAQGVAVFLDKAGRVMSAGVAIDRSPEIPQGFEPAPALTLVLNGRSLVVKAGTTLDELTSRLGVSPKIDRDEEEILANLVVGPAGLEIEAELDGRVRWVNLYRP